MGSVNKTSEVRVEWHLLKCKRGQIYFLRVIKDTEFLRVCNL